MVRHTLVILGMLMIPGLVRAELTCTRPTISLEEIRGGKLLTQWFHLRNGGSGTIEILDVHPSCGCLKPQLDKKLFLGGEEARLQMVVNTLTQPAGPHTWTVTVKYHGNGEDRELVLTVTGVVVPDLLVEPAALILNTDSTCSHDLVLTERRPEPLTFKAVESTSPGLTVQTDAVQKNADGTWSRKIHLKVLEKLSPGRYEEMVQIFTTDADFPELKFPVTLVKRPRLALQATPASVHFSGRQGEPLPGRIVLLGGQTDRQIKIDRIEVGDSAIRCTSAQGPGSHWTLKIQINTSDISQRMESEVRVYVSGQEIPVSIPVVVNLDR